MPLRYFRETTQKWCINTQFVWDTDVERGAWLTFDRGFKGQSRYNIKNLISDVRESTWIETDEHGNPIPTPEIEAEKAAAKEARNKATETRHIISNELGANVFGRLFAIEQALESRDWSRARSELTTLLTFIPTPEPEYTYYKNPCPHQMVRGWRVHNNTGTLERWGSSKRWERSQHKGIESLPWHYSPERVASESDINKE